MAGRGGVEVGWRLDRGVGRGGGGRGRGEAASLTVPWDEGGFHSLTNIDTGDN